MEAYLPKKLAPADRAYLNALAAGDREGVRRALDEGADPKRVAAANMPDPALEAVARGDIGGLLPLLTHPGAQGYAPDPNGGNLLHVVAARGGKCSRYDVTQLVMLAGARSAFFDRAACWINARDRHGSTPLYRAANKGNAHVAEALLWGGADPLAGVEDGSPLPLHAAARNNHADACSVLCNPGPLPARMISADKPKPAPDQQAKVEALMAEHWRKLQRELADAHAVSAGGDRPRPHLVAETAAGNLPIHEAAARGAVAAVAVLMSVDPATAAARNAAGETPLHLAALGGHAAACSLLLSCAADRAARAAAANAKTAAGATPLLLACLGSYSDTCAVLAAAGADICARDGANAWALDWWGKLRKGGAFEGAQATMVSAAIAYDKVGKRAGDA